MEKKPTIYDIAKALGVSTGTVNRALHNKPEISEETKKRVLDMAAQMNFKMNPVAQSLRRKAFKIGIVLLCPVKDYLYEIKRGMDKALSNIGEFNLHTEYLIYDITTNDKIEAEIANKLHFFIKEQYDGVVLMLTTQNKEITKELINNSNIKVAGVSSKILGSDDVQNVCVHGETAGGLAAEVLNLCCNKRTICILTGTTDLSPHKENIEGFYQFHKKYPFNSIKIYTHNDDPKQVEEQTKKMLEECPDIDGIYMNTASAPLACKIIDQIKPDHKYNIVTTDLTDETKDLLARGRIRATIYQNPFLQGKRAIELLYQRICENDTELTYYVNPQIVFSMNADNI